MGIMVPMTIVVLRLSNVYRRRRLHSLTIAAGAACQDIPQPFSAAAAGPEV
eukprot:CAMPEP_0204270614 /NCGR_PEP_ID=MMETSP0468-20130131/18995_1 /ASSEMBLY_ACC=CAM_ASM_000383 /TAXON_ID=2969 /ORGANISM="Oxyrrhis marina" /LENGTH=50 /DNA_ID=CAMNT_0051246169 /DNA_START=20 /DNA_END=172 /DNA_ORIENTATION=-